MNIIEILTDNYSTNYTRENLTNINATDISKLIGPNIKGVYKYRVKTPTGLKKIGYAKETKEHGWGTRYSYLDADVKEQIAKQTEDYCLETYYQGTIGEKYLFNASKQLHNESGPAFTYYNKAGIKEVELYFLNGEYKGKDLNLYEPYSVGNYFIL